MATSLWSRAPGQNRPVPTHDSTLRKPPLRTAFLEFPQGLACHARFWADCRLTGMYGPPLRRKRNVWSAASPQAKCEDVTSWSAQMYVWSAASPQAKCEDVTSWSTQMYTAFVGVDHSWPRWN